MYVNFLVKIKNAQQAGKDNLRAPFSKMDLAIAEVLIKYGFLKKTEVKGKPEKKIIEIDLNQAKKINGIKFKSLSSRKIYAGYKEIRSVKSGYGLLVVSTSKGIMAGSEARKQKLGGQLLFEIW
jgi:small subunit ribosomal protein S8